MIPDDAGPAQPGEGGDDLTPQEKENLMLDEMPLPGAPKNEAERRAQWRRLPQRTRVAVRRLHRQFGHLPPSTLVSLLRASRASPDFIKAAKLHKCQACEETTPKPRGHPVSANFTYGFNEVLGVDVLEVKDASGARFSV